MRIIVFLIAFTASSAYGQDGMYDTSFANNGVATTDVSGDEEFSKLVSENTDGTLWVHAVLDISSNVQNVLIRYTSNGTYDTNFGNNGIVDVAVQGGFSNLVALPDGKMLLGGVSNSDFLIIRYLSDGTIDSTFGNNGTVIIDYADDSRLNIFLNPDGSIIAAGMYRDSGQEGFILSKILSDGSLDQSFGINGIAATQITSEELFSFPIIHMDDGALLTTFNIIDANDMGTFGLAKFTSNGTIDTTFGNNGVALSPIVSNGSLIVNAVEIKNTKVLAFITDDGSNPPNSTQSYFARFSEDGSMDMNFGQNGKRFLPQPSIYPRKIIKQSNGRLLIYGREWSIDGGNYTILRTFSNGFTDNSFGNLGRFFEADFDSGDAIIASDGGVIGTSATPWFNAPQDIILFKLFNNPLHIDEFEFSSLKAYPNPTSGTVQLSCVSCKLESNTYSIFDIFGKVIRTGTFETNSPILNMRSFSSGVYFLRSTNFTIKLIKK